MYKYSLCIPSRARLSQLRQSLASLAAINREDLEIIVSLNGYTNDEEQLLRQMLDDQRVRFVKAPQLLSMVENFEFALSHTTGEYVTLMGDDDTLVSDALDIADGHFNQNSSTVLSWFRWPYYWPSSRIMPGILFVHPRQPAYRIEVARMMPSFSQSFPNYQYLPCIYNSFFPRSLINIIKNLNNGAFWPKKHVIAPDVFNAFQTISAVEDFFYIRYPISISGISDRSGGMSDPNQKGSEIRKFAKELGRASVRDLPDVRLVPSESILLCMASDLLRLAEITESSVYSRFSAKFVAKLAVHRYYCQDIHTNPEHENDFMALARKYKLNIDRSFVGKSECPISYVDELFGSQCLVKQVRCHDLGIHDLTDVAMMYPSLASSIKL